MGNTNENLKIMRENAKGKTGRKQGSKNKKTLLKEEAELTLRERYIEKMMPHLNTILDVHILEAHNPKNTKEREGVIEQLIDKAKQRTEVDVSIDKLEVLSDKIKEILEKKR